MSKCQLIGHNDSKQANAMLLAVITIFLASFLSPFIVKRTGDYAGWILGAVPFFWLVYLASHTYDISQGTNTLESIPWLPGFDVNLSFYLDGLSLVFALLILGIGSLVLVYTSGYLKGHPKLARFFLFIMSFMASMLGVVIADNIILLFIFWELTSVTSYMLIGFDHKRIQARSAALQALVVTGIGGLALLAGLLMLGSMAGSFEISEIIQRGDQIIAHPLYGGMLVLVLLGCFTKSAQFPFHFWLPNAMEAPTPASAYLHSSTMVKAGVYLLARLSPALSGTDAWHITVTTFGAVTMVTAAFMALHQTYLKKLLAYTTVSVLGTLVMLIGYGADYALKAAMVYLIGHAFYKGAMFLIAGILDHETGEKNVTRLGGLMRAMPITAAAAFLAGLSMMGAPPMLGFLGKETLYEATMHATISPFFLTSAAMFASIIMVAIAGMVGLRPFVGVVQETPKHAHEPPISMWLGPITLATLGLLFGLFPGFTGKMLISASAVAAAGDPFEVKLYLWHGFTPVLGLSVLTLLLGALVYYFIDTIRNGIAFLERAYAFGPDFLYGKGMEGLILIANWQTAILQNGYLRYYIITSVVATIGIMLYVMSHVELVSIHMDLNDIRFFEVGLVILSMSGAIAAIRSTSRLGAVASLGVVGYSVALIFVLYGAPDLAMTQFVVETLTVILFVLVFYHLPSFKKISTTPTHVRDLIIAVSAGALMTTLILIANEIQFYDTISSYYAENSYSKAYGRNVVNVILVDFRAIDTLGEIIVLAVAALGAYGLLRLRPERKQES